MKLNRFNPYISTRRWVKKGDENTFDGFIDKNYIPIGDNQNLNRILDNSAREKYKIALEFIKDVAPKINSKKIPEANIQQAFVFDTAYNLSKKQFTKILSVGAFEDTAAIALKKLGFQIEFIDPIINYDLSTFMTKPSVKKQSYDIIISTSVIEHVEDDENFIKDISSLLKIGGWGILTCDFNNNYKNGDEIPHEDYRFYTKKDLSERLLGDIPDCKIVGTPDWDCDCYDFVYLNRYRYTFASFVFTKMSI
jgi:SAM-dependent methyltransferase